MATEPIQAVRDRFRSARARTAEREARIEEDGFLELPPRLQNQLAVLQAQCEEPVDDDHQALVAAEHNLKSYNAKLEQAESLLNQLAGARQRQGSDRRQSLRRLVLWLLILSVVGGAAVLGYHYVRERKAELCAGSPACRTEGLCAGGVRFDPPLVELTCEATADEHCRASQHCRDRGKCFAVLGRCIARDDDDCRKAPPCKLDGLCTARDDRCVAASRKDCQATPGCVERGACTPSQGVCVVRSNDDCQHALACKQHGACTEVQGKCVRLEGDE